MTRSGGGGAGRGGMACGDGAGGGAATGTGLGVDPFEAAFFARGRAGFVGRLAVAGASVERRFLGAALARFFAAFLGDFDGRLLAAFFAGAFDRRLLAAFFAGAFDGRLLAVFLEGALVARFLVALRGALDARFFVVCLVAIAPPEASTISESRCLATAGGAQPSTT